MPFGNLLKQPNRGRFLLALSAGAAAVAIYLSADHFRVVPGTAALDEGQGPSTSPGAYSVMVVPRRSQCAENIPEVLGLELIRRLQRIPGIEVIAPLTALALAESRQLGEAPPIALETAWSVEVGCQTGDEGSEISAHVMHRENSRTGFFVTEPYAVEGLEPFVADTIRNLVDHIGTAQSASGAGSGPVDPAAFMGFLRSRYYFLLGSAGAQQAQILLEEAIESEPDWPDALAAHAYSLILQSTLQPDQAESLLESATASLAHALAQQPDHPDSLLYRSLIAHRFEWRWQVAYDSAKAALQGAPGSAEILAAVSTAAFTLGKFEEGVELIQKAIRLDPMVLGHRLRYGLMLEFDGKYQSAIDAYRELMELNPESPGVRAYLGRTLVVAGRAEAALPHMEIETSPFWRDYGMVLVLYALDRNAEADERFSGFIDDHAGEAAMQIAEIHAFTGNNDEALSWLTRAVEQRDPGVAELIGNPLLETLSGEERWNELLNRLDLGQQSSAEEH